MSNPAWRYGDAGDRIPLELNCAVRVGPHTLVCADLEAGAGALLRSLMPLPPDLAYVDPPWGASVAKAYRTKAGDSREVDYEHLLSRVLELCALARRDVLIETGHAQVEQTVQLLPGHGLRHVQTYGITYMRGRPCALIHASRLAGQRPALPVEGLAEEKAVSAALRVLSRPGDRIIDPCIGRGLTARMALVHGLIVYGSELNPRRLAVTVEGLVNAGLPLSRIDLPPLA